MTSKEASVEESKEEKEWKVRVVATDQGTEGRVGYSKNLGFCTEWNVELLEGFEQKGDMI